jgi:hypothetical protein
VASKKQGPSSNQLDANYREAGVVQPGAHPEFDQPTPVEKIQGMFRKASDLMRGQMNSTGSKRSPSTVSDRRLPAMSDAERERLSKKYLGG